MEQNYKMNKLPKGLIILALLIGLSALFSIVRLFFQPDLHMVFLGLSISGVSIILYNVLNGILNITVSIGLLKRRIWSYYVFLILTLFYLFNFLVNLLMTRHEVLIEVGWKLTDDSMTPFYIIQWFAIGFSLLIFLWLKKYRSILQ